MSFLKSVPPLNALRTFEAAARHGSFKQAAEELCVTQAAVSRQVQVVETFYGRLLFQRLNRQVRLTAEGERLAKAASAALALLAEASAEIWGEQPGAYLPLLTTPAFAQLWLAPRLGSLRAAQPALRLQLVAQEHNPDYREGFDAAITLGLEEHSGYAAVFLFAEEMFPVCTPAFLAQYPTVGTLAGLLQAPLLGLSARHWKPRHWQPVDWRYWFSALGSPGTPQEVMSFSHYPALLDAVLAGEGVGLAWRHLVQPPLASGSLVQPVPECLAAPDRRHYFVYRLSGAYAVQCQALAEWLHSETAALRA